MSDIGFGDIYWLIGNLFTLLFQGFVSFLLPCFAVDHLYLSSDEYLFSEEETPIAEGKRQCLRDYHFIKSSLLYDD